MTFVKSTTTVTALRTATIVTVTNQGAEPCNVSVDWLFGQSTAVACTTTLALAVGRTVDFCSRTLPSGITACNATCDPPLTALEGKARVGSTSSTAANKCQRIAVSARVYYTSAATDIPVDAISDSKIVKVNAANAGD